MWNLENNTGELISRAEIETQVENQCIDTKDRREWDELEDKNWHIQSSMYKIDN